MRTRLLPLAFAIVAIVALVAAAAARAQDGSGDPVVDAIRDVLHGADAGSRAAGRRALLDDPEAAVPVLLRALEELAAARRPPAAFAGVAQPRPGPAPAAAPAADEDAAVLRVYDVRDLVESAGSVEGLATRIRALVGSEDTVAVHDGGQVVVRTAPLRQDDVRRLLDGLRAEPSEIVTIETRIVRAPFEAPLGRAASDARPGDVLDLADPERSVADWLASGDVEVVTSPRLSCFPGQQASVQAGRQVSFVADFEVEVAQGGTIADPVIDTVYEGVDVEVTPCVPDAGRVMLRLRVSSSDIVEMERRSVTLADPSEPVEIQSPAVLTTALARSLDLPDGGCAVVRLGDDRTGRRYLVIGVARDRVE